MIKRVFWRWRYRKLKLADPTDPLGHVERLIALHKFARQLPLNVSGYEQRIRHRITVRTRYVAELLLAIEDVSEMMSVRLEHIDKLAWANRDYTTVNIDQYCVNKRGVGLDDHDVFHRLYSDLETLLAQIATLQKEKPALLMYYNQGARYLWADGFVVLDALIAMHLGVSDVERHSQSLTKRRQGLTLS